jgi:hypothetical protein
LEAEAAKLNEKGDKLREQARAAEGEVAAKRAEATHAAYLARFTIEEIALHAEKKKRSDENKRKAAHANADFEVRSAKKALEQAHSGGDSELIERRERELALAEEALAHA